LFQGWATTARPPHTTIVGGVLKVALQVDASLPDGFRVKACQCGNLFGATSAQQGRQKTANPSLLPFVKTSKHQRDVFRPIPACHCSRCCHDGALHGPKHGVEDLQKHNLLGVFGK
jgi:hypothetical protein